MRLLLPSIRFQPSLNTSFFGSIKSNHSLFLSLVTSCSGKISTLLASNYVFPFVNKLPVVSYRLFINYNIRTYCIIASVLLILHLLDMYRTKRRPDLIKQHRNNLNITEGLIFNVFYYFVLENIESFANQMTFKKSLLHQKAPECRKVQA